MIMIIEVRTYRLKPGSVAEVEKRFAEKLPEREKLSKLAAFWHTEVGPLNEIIHVWPYDSFEQRLEIRAKAISLGIWPPANGEFIENMQSEIFIPAPFSPPLTPREVGPVFEIRSYTLAPGALPGMMDRWAAKIDERVKLSPLVGASTYGPIRMPGNANVSALMPSLGDCGRLVARAMGWW
jgi:hypothetical protein